MNVLVRAFRSSWLSSCKAVVMDSQRSAGCARNVHIDFAHCFKETSLRCCFLIRIEERSTVVSHDALPSSCFARP
jgi:hypothetical protein